MKKETTIALLCIICITLISLSPDIKKWITTPPGHTFQPIHNSLIDYPVYISFIKQGIDGQILLFDRFTTELHTGSRIVPLYLILGWIGKCTGITNPHIIYHTIRIALGIIWTVTAYWFVRQFFKETKSRILALFLILYSTSVPYVSGSSINWYMDWWSELSPISRMVFLPHHLLGHILLLVTIGLIIKKPKVALCTGFIAGLVHPPTSILLIILLPLWMLITKQFHVLVRILWIIALWLIPLALLYTQSASGPWERIRAYDQLMFAISIPEYLLALGPIVVLAGIGLFHSPKKSWAVLFLLWIMIPIGGLFFMPRFSQIPGFAFQKILWSNVRFLQMAIQVPLAILSVWAIMWTKERFGRLVYDILIVSLVVCTLIGYPWALQREWTHEFGGPLYQYPTTTWMQAVQSLASSDNKQKAVLSLPFAGLTIASTTNRPVFIGRDVYTDNLNQKTDQAWTFLTGSMPICDAYELVTKNSIGEVFVGYDEKKAGGDMGVYPFLKNTLNLGDVQIYTVMEKHPDVCGPIKNRLLESPPLRREGSFNRRQMKKIYYSSLPSVVKRGKI